MGKWIYRKLEARHIQGICVRCNKSNQKYIGKNKQGERNYAPTCRNCQIELGWFKQSSGGTKYKKYKKDHCEKCGFIPEHICQLDVDHVDGNHTNNDIDNLQTLCANCHRLKTWQCKEGIHDPDVINSRNENIKKKKEII